MTEWTRDTPWRQGSFISREDLVELGLPIEDGHVFGLVISHDCDLASDGFLEPKIEVILLEALKRLDGNCTYSKNPRCLHFSVSRGDGQEIFLEAKAINKVSVDKVRMLDFSPVEGLTLPQGDGEILQRWLACRYRRQALPNTLVERMGRLQNRIEKQAKREVSSIVGIWISFEPWDEVDEYTPYEIDIYCVYSIDEDPNAAEKAETAVRVIKEYCESNPSSSGEDGKNGIYLGRCEAVSEEGFTLRDMRRNVELKMDHLSYRGSEPGPMTP